MDYKPPINTRTTEQLIEIVETKKKWKPDVVEMAKVELLKRGVSLDIPERRRKSKIKYERKVELIKSRATYSTNEKILIVLLGPLLFMLFHDPFIFRPGQGFKIKNRQGIFYLLIGLGLWGTIFYIYYKYFG